MTRPPQSAALPQRWNGYQYPGGQLGGGYVLGGAMAAILVVEDEAQVRVLSESYLRDQGHETLSAANVEEALAVLQAANAIDLLFTDISLQGDLQAGLTLAQRATER